jgi:hypothetical protein
MPRPVSSSPEWLSVKTAGRPIGVDQKARRINGMIVAQEGDFKSDGRGSFDEQSLAMIMRLIQAAPKGVKSRLSHATLSDDGVSKYLGRVSEPWLDMITLERDGKQYNLKAVRGNLQLSDTAFDGNPNGNIGQYVLDLATEDPDALSSSLVLQTDFEHRLDEKGRPMKDDDGNELPPLWRPTAIHGSDIVAIGDAVDGLLSAGVNVAGLPDAIVRQATELLDRQFAGQRPEVIEARCAAWLDRYLAYRFGSNHRGYVAGFKGSPTYDRLCETA